MNCLTPKKRAVRLGRNLGSDLHGEYTVLLSAGDRVRFRAEL